jgi:hypothetical protein
MTNEERIAAIEVEIKLIERLFNEREKLSKLEIVALEKLLDERERGNKVALKLQADETDRRLDSLNHENARIKELQSACVGSGVYEIEHNHLTDDIGILKSYMNNQQGRQVVWSVVLPLGVSFIISLVFVLINYFLNK